MRILVGFFCGVLMTLFLLVPGKTGPTVLISGSAEQQMADLDQAGRKLEGMGDTALALAYRARDMVRAGMVDENQ